VPIETWKTREAGEAGQGQRNLQMAHGEGVALQHTLGGDPMSGHAPVNQQGENHAPAARYNGYAEHKVPGRAKGRDKRCMANDDTCMGWATNTGLCRPHSVKAAE
jgi:hypothetical protein